MLFKSNTLLHYAYNSYVNDGHQTGFFGDDAERDFVKLLSTRHSQHQQFVIRSRIVNST